MHKTSQVSRKRDFFFSQETSNILKKIINKVTLGIIKQIEGKGRITAAQEKGFLVLGTCSWMRSKL